MAIQTYVPLQDWEHQKKSKDTAYRERNYLVAFLARQYSSHLKRHPNTDKEWEDDWRWIVCVHSPAGQMTWHIHDSELEVFGFLNRKTNYQEFNYDGCKFDEHTTEEKYKRLAELPMAGKVKDM